MYVGPKLVELYTLMQKTEFIWIGSYLRLNSINFNAISLRERQDIHFELEVINFTQSKSKEYNINKTQIGRNNPWIYGKNVSRKTKILVVWQMKYVVCDLVENMNSLFLNLIFWFAFWA